MKHLTALLLTLALASAIHAAPLISGSPVPVGTPDRTGPLSLGLTNYPVAALNITNSPRPDLLMMVGAHSPSPGFYLFTYDSTSATGAPIFKNPQFIPNPGNPGVPPPNVIFQTPDNTIHAFFLNKNSIHRYTLDTKLLNFIKSAPPISLKNLPRNPSRIAVLLNKDNSLQIFLSISDGTGKGPEGNKRSPDYKPYDGALIYTGTEGFSSIYGATLASPLDNTSSISVKLAAPSTTEVLAGYLVPASLTLDGKTPALIAGNRWGNLLYYTIKPDGTLSHRKLAASTAPDHVAYRTPAINATPAIYPNAKTKLPSDIIVGGESALQYIAFTGNFSPETGAPIYAPATPVLLQNALLYPGTLPVLSAADWDGDGAIDLISGNSDGQVLLFKNIGNNTVPAFAPAVEIEAGGSPIHIQQAYVNVQGPGEQRWGYSCPRVFDWNNDGLPDIVTSSATARHEVYLNTGTPTKPNLALPRRLYCDGLDVHGTWRVQPAIARIGNNTAYIALDNDDELHLYWRIDNQNIADAGKIPLEDGTPIKANFLSAGGTGRLKLQLVDWDLDGKLDLLIGTPRHGSVPNPKTGLPQSLGLPGAAVLFLKNIGTNESPRYAFPKLMKHKGNPIFHNQHACSPLATPLGDPNPDKAPNLFVGDQEGLIYYYSRKHLSWD